MQILNRWHVRPGINPRQRPIASITSRPLGLMCQSPESQPARRARTIGVARFFHGPRGTLEPRHRLAQSTISCIRDGNHFIGPTCLGKVCDILTFAIDRSINLTFIRARYSKAKSLRPYCAVGGDLVHCASDFPLTISGGKGTDDWDEQEKLPFPDPLHASLEFSCRLFTGRSMGVPA